MSLAERVRHAERMSIRSKGGVDKDAYGVERLREEVGQFVSFEKIAAILAENPERARNELRAACRKVLASSAWEIRSEAEKESLVSELMDVVFGMGPIDALISDESITEIMVNGAKDIFFERAGKLVRSPLSFDGDDQVRVLIDRIISPLGRRIDESSPLVNARLPEGHRVHAVIPPISPDGPHLTIRAFTRRVMTLEEMMERGSLGADMLAFLGWLVQLRKNVVVSGGTGSGKTTLLNAMSRLIPKSERVVTIEDSLEMKFDEGTHVVRLEARPVNSEGTGEVTIRELVINALRMRPDRIIVGECRSGEAIDMLQAMNTGHDGSLTTLHANSPDDVVERMVTMVRYAVDLPVDAIEAQIGNAFDYIVQVARSSSGQRYLCAIAEVSFDRAARRCRVDSVYERTSYSKEGSWLKVPSIVHEVSEHPESFDMDEQELLLWSEGLRSL